MNVENIVREYIDKTLHMSLATSIDNKPWVCEVHFAYDGDLNLYFRSKKDRRHSLEINKNSFVSGNIVAQHAINEYPHAIYFEGNATLVKDDSQYYSIYEYFKQRQDVTESIIDDAKDDDGHKFYKITVNNWFAFGKFGNEKGQKYELAWDGGNK